MSAARLIQFGWRLVPTNGSMISLPPDTARCCCSHLLEFALRCSSRLPNARQQGRQCSKLRIPYCLIYKFLGCSTDESCFAKWARSTIDSWNVTRVSDHRLVCGPRTSVCGIKRNVECTGGASTPGYRLQLPRCSYSAYPTQNQWPVTPGLECRCG